MQFTIETKAAKAAIAALTVSNAKAGPIIEARSTLPILAYAMISASSADATVTIAGTNLDCFAECTVPGYGTPGASICIEARAFKDAIGKVKADLVTLTDLGGGRVAMAAKDGTGATVKLAAMGAADFPRFVTLKPGDGASFAMPAEELAADLARLAPCISTEETRYYLNGIFMHLAEVAKGAFRFRMAATDGHRLGRIDRPVPAGAEKLADMIVPRIACGFIARALGKKPAGMIAWQATPAKIAVELPGWRFHCKLVDGTFPDYSRVIPSSNRNRIEVDPVELAAEVEAVTAHLSDRIRAVNVTAAKGWGTVWATDPTNGPAGAVIGSAVLASAEGEDDTAWFGVNARYLRDMLGAFGSAPVIIQTEREHAPMRFDSPDAPEFLGVLMPMRTDRGEVTPEAIRKLTQTPVEAVAEEAANPGWHFRDKVKAAIEHETARLGGRYEARLSVLALIEGARGEPGRASAILAHPAPEPGGFVRWAAISAAIEAEAASRSPAAPMAERRVRTAAHERLVRAAWKQRASKLANRRAWSDAVTRQGEVRLDAEALETRNRRLAAVLAGRKRQLAMVGEALAISRERSARLTRQAAVSGVSLTALAHVA